MDDRLKIVEREEFSNTYGTGLRLRVGVAEKAPYLPLPHDFVPNATSLERRLSLVRGVGPHTEQRLRREGYDTLAQLVRHERYGPDALRVWQALARRSTSDLVEAGAKDVELLPLFSLEEAAVVDIETVGLWRVLPVFLIGYGTRVGDRWEIRQFFARGFEEEAAVLYEVARELADKRVCVTYNGKAFDEPFVQERLRLHGLETIRFHLHVDLMHACRRAFRHHWPDCKLGTVGSRLFGVYRHDDPPGYMVPDLYYRYIRDADEKAVGPILRHNALDILVLAWLLDAAWAALSPSDVDEVG